MRFTNIYQSVVRHAYFIELVLNYKIKECKYGFKLLIIDMFTDINIFFKIFLLDIYIYYKMVI